MLGSPGGSDNKESACNAGDAGSIPGLGESPGEGNGNPLQYSCLENRMDRGGWWATAYGVTESWITPPNILLVQASHMAKPPSQPLTPIHSTS